MLGDKENAALYKAEKVEKKGESILMIGGVFLTGSMITAELAAVLALISSDISVFEDGLVLALTIGVPALMVSSIGNLLVTNSQKQIQSCLAKIESDEENANKKLEEKKVKFGLEREKGETSGSRMRAENIKKRK